MGTSLRFSANVSKETMEIKRQWKDIKTLGKKV